MKQKKAISILCLVLAVVMILSLVISVLPGRAYAVTQADIDALKAKKAAITERKNQAQEVLDELKERGIDPYPSKSHRNTKIIDIINHFDEKAGQDACVAGRIVAIRSFGKLVFLKLRDYTGEVQIFMKASSEPTPDGMLGAKDVRLLDLGDFIEATGRVDNFGFFGFCKTSNQIFEAVARKVHQ